MLVFFFFFSANFCVCDRVFNPTIEVVAFRLRGWCMMHVSFLLACTRLGHEYQDCFESVLWDACVHRLDLGLYFHPKEFLGNGVRTLVNSKGKIPCACLKLATQLSLSKPRFAGHCKSRVRCGFVKERIRKNRRQNADGGLKDLCNVIARGQPIDHCQWELGEEH